MARDYYKILGIARNATKEEIKKRYRELAHKFHPDKGGDEARFKEVNEAYQVLADESKRAQYDQFGREFDFSDVFEDFLGFGFGGGGGGRGKARERKGKDIRVDLEIPFEESILGGKRGLELSKF